MDTKTHEPLIVTDDFDAEFCIIGGRFTDNYDIRTLSLLSRQHFTDNEPRHLSSQVNYNVLVGLVGVTFSLYYKTKKSAKVTYDILMKAATK